VRRRQKAVAQIDRKRLESRAVGDWLTLGERARLRDLVGTEPFRVTTSQL
jgi:hypothetical protein